MPQEPSRAEAQDGLDALGAIFRCTPGAEAAGAVRCGPAACRQLALGPELALEVERRDAALEVAVVQELSLMRKS